MAQVLSFLVSTGHDDTVGVVFPVFREHIERFLSERKKVFVKFAGERMFPRLQVGSKLFFYESQGAKEIVGEARIVEITQGTVDEVLARFGRDLFLTRSELEAYAGSRRGRRMLVLVLEDMTRYSLPLRLDRGITMTGRYVTKTMLDDLRVSQE
jgi:hypothetical protein